MKGIRPAVEVVVEVVVKVVVEFEVEFEVEFDLELKKVKAKAIITNYHWEKRDIKLFVKAIISRCVDYNNKLMIIMMILNK